MKPEIAGSLAIGVVTAIIAVAAFWLSARAARAQHAAVAKGVDAAAYDRARELYESAIDNLQEETRRLEAQVASLRAEVAQVHDQAGLLQAEIRKLRSSNDALRRELVALKGGKL